MELLISVERLQSFDSDYEPSGLMTPNDRKELERRRAERLQNGELETENTEQNPHTEQTAVAAN